MVVKKLKTRVARTKNLKKLIGGSNDLSFEPLWNTLPSEKPQALPQRNKGVKEIQIKHFWFKDWPDHGVPKEEEQFKNFIAQVKNDIKENGGTTVIHCSAGVGRTGVTMIALKMLFDNTLTISEAINDARNGRMWIVQSEEQYNFLNNMFSDRLVHKKTLKNVIFGKKYIKTIPKFNELNNPNTKTNPELFYKMPQECKTQNQNQSKNRYGDILPYDNTRVVLETTQPNNSCSDYINANKFTNYFDANLDVIATQCPTANTINDFKRMLLQENVKRIVMVTNLVERGLAKCNDYTGDLSKRSNNDTIKDYCLRLNTNNRIEFVYDSCSVKKPKNTINNTKQQLQLNTKSTNKRGLFGRIWNKITRKNKTSSNV